MNILIAQPALPAIVSSITWVDIVRLIVLPILLPGAVGLITKATWPTLVKRLSLGVLTLVTSVLVGILASQGSGTSFDLGNAIVSWLLTWGLAELAYWGIYKAPVATPVPNPDTSVTGNPVDLSTESLSKLTKADLITLAQTPPGIVTLSNPAPATTLATIVGAAGNK